MTYVLLLMEQFRRKMYGRSGIHLIESGRVIDANGLINYLNNLLRHVNHHIWVQIQR